jgi:PAS domain S-box-containing protein
VAKHVVPERLDPMLQLSLAPDPSSAAEARRFTADVLREWHEDPLADAVVLLVSELVTNALLHAGSPVQLALGRRSGHVRVDVVDESPVMPGVRDYDDEATTGRGLGLVEMVAESWGVEPRHPRGKSVWFEMPSTQHIPEEHGAPAAPPPAAPTSVRRATDTVTVRLLGAPVRLFPAMQQHTDALLREYTLIAMESSDTPVPPPIQIDLNSVSEQVAAATAAGSVTTELLLDVPATARGSVLETCEVLEHADSLAADGRLLHTSALPEVRGCRNWFFDQLLTQLDGGEPDPWVITMATDDVAPADDVDFGAVLDELSDAIVIADDRNHVVHANAAMEQVLGWPPGELAGQRLTTIIPERLREAHVAGYTRYMVTREARLIGQPVRVPARHRDGSEVEVQLTLHAFRPPGHRQMFMGVLHVPEPVDPEPSDDGIAVSAALETLERLTAHLSDGPHDRHQLLRLLGEGLERRFAAWWEIDEGQLRCAAAWECETGRYDPFCQATLQRRFDPGEGLPGRVWSTSRPEWVPDVVADANFPRVALAVQAQLRTAFAFPVIASDRVVGVVELFGEAIEPRDAAVLQALAAAGRVLGLIA